MTVKEINEQNKALKQTLKEVEANKEGLGYDKQTQTHAPVRAAKIAKPVENSLPMRELSK